MRHVEHGARVALVMVGLFAAGGCGDSDEEKMLAALRMAASDPDSAAQICHPGPLEGASVAQLASNGEPAFEWAPERVSVLEDLVEAGLLEPAVVANTRWTFRERETKVYPVTSLGKSKMRFGKLVGFVFGGLCIGTRVPTHIVEYTEPGQTGPGIEATFEFRVHLDSELVERIPTRDSEEKELAKFAAMTGTGRATIVKTNRGYSARELSF